MTIFGLGTIGEQVARRVVGWDMRLIGIKRDVGSYRGAVGDVRPPNELLEACMESDVLVLTAPATQETLRGWTHGYWRRSAKDG